MKLAPRIALLFAAVVFGSLVLPGLFAPQSVANLLGLRATSVAGDNELRAIYGGLTGGIALFMAIASMRPKWHSPGLVLQVCIFGGMVAARVVSIAASGSPGALVYVVLAGETLGGVVALVALRGMPARSSA